MKILFLVRTFIFKQNIKKYFCFLLMIAGLTGCVRKIRLYSGYYKSPSRVGLIIDTNKIVYKGRVSAPGTGLVGALIVSGIHPRQDGYDTILQAIEPGLNPTQGLIKFYKDLFLSKGKSLEVINENFELNTVEAFHDFQPADTRKEYYRKDIRFLKEKYNIDELLVVRITSTLIVRYAYGIESNKFASALLFDRIYDLNDNSIMMEHQSYAWVRIYGKLRTPPAYENLSKGIRESIKSAIEKEKKEF